MMKASAFASNHLLAKHTKNQAQGSDQSMGSRKEWLSLLFLTQQAISCQILEKAVNNEVSITLLLMCRHQTITCILIYKARSASLRFYCNSR